ncbi:hypothetical protein IT570_08580 [Candidatus Sumerlaeota bacterium]|nr:hypothetical protein [Candidatus Sumerlaeota bacterium]
MENSTELLMAVGGVFLVSWFGASRLRIDRRNLPSLRMQLTQIDRAVLAALHGEFQRTSHEESYPGGAVVCIQCGIEYAAGRVYCDCGNETIDADDFDDATCPIGTGGFDESDASPQEMVCIHVADDYWQAALLKSYLESHGVDCATLVQGRPGIQHLSLLPKPQMGLYVQADSAALARQLLSKSISD